MAESAVVEEPLKESPSPKPPSGKTNIGTKYREALAALTPKSEPVPEKERLPEGDKPDPPKPTPAPDDKTPPADKTPSALDLAMGDTKPAPPSPSADDKAWEQEDAVKELDPKTANWGKARESIGRQSIQIKTLTQEIETLKGQAAKGDPKAVGELAQVRDELTRAREKIAQQEQSIKAVNAEYSDEYQGLVKKYEGEMAKTIKRFESFAGKGTGDKLADALSMAQGKFRTDAIKAALADLDPEDKTRVFTQIEEVDKAVDAISEFRADLPAKFEEISRNREEQTRVHQEKANKQLESDFESIVAELPKGELNVFLRPVPDNATGADTWNGAIKQAHEVALRNLKPGSTLEESATLLVKGADYDRVVKYALDTRKQLQEARERLAAFDEASPDFKGTSRKPSEKPLTPGERYHKAKAELTASGDF